MTFTEAMKRLRSEDRFRATVYAMNTLLLHKGVYTDREFRRLFVEHARKTLGRIAETKQKRGTK